MNPNENQTEVLNHINFIGIGIYDNSYKDFDNMFKLSDAILTINEYIDKDYRIDAIKFDIDGFGIYADLLITDDEFETLEKYFLKIGDYMIQ